MNALVLDRLHVYNSYLPPLYVHNNMNLNILLPFSFYYYIDQSLLFSLICLRDSFAT